jgi:hypothetical protein
LVRASRKLFPFFRHFLDEGDNPAKVIAAQIASHFRIPENAAQYYGRREWP